LLKYVKLEKAPIRRLQSKYEKNQRIELGVAASFTHLLSQRKKKERFLVGCSATRLFFRNSYSNAAV
jgi:hypothetical protein